MDTITFIGAGIGILTAIITLLLNIHVLHEHKRKKFRAELENYEEYFDKYYDPTGSRNLPLLIQDKAAQNLTRMKFLNHDLLTYLINFHEQQKISLDKILDHLFFCYDLIEIKKENGRYYFKSKLKFPYLRKYLNYSGYIIFISYAIVLHTSFGQDLFSGWIKIFITIGAICISLASLNRADNINESIIFLKLIKELNTPQEKQEIKITEKINLLNQ